jgi:hypothetical protein
VVITHDVVEHLPLCHLGTICCISRSFALYLTLTKIQVDPCACSCNISPQLLSFSHSSSHTHSLKLLLSHSNAFTLVLGCSISQLVTPHGCILYPRVTASCDRLSPCVCLLLSTSSSALYPHLVPCLSALYYISFHSMYLQGEFLQCNTPKFRCSITAIISNLQAKKNLGFMLPKWTFWLLDFGVQLTSGIT